MTSSHDGVQPAADAVARLEHDTLDAGRGELPRGRQPRDAGPDDDYSFDRLCDRVGDRVGDDRLAHGASLGVIASASPHSARLHQSDARVCYQWVIPVGGVGSPGTEHAMKKLVIAVAVAFVAFYLFTRPQESADVVHSALDLVTNAFDSVITFLTALFS